MSISIELKRAGAADAERAGGEAGAFGERAQQRVEQLRQVAERPVDALEQFVSDMIARKGHGLPRTSLTRWQSGTRIRQTIILSIKYFSSKGANCSAMSRF